MRSDEPDRAVLQIVERMERKLDALTKDGPRIFNRTETAKQIGCSYRHLAVLVDTGMLHPGCTIDGKRYWWPEAIEDCVRNLQRSGSSITSKMSKELDKLEDRGLAS